MAMRVLALLLGRARRGKHERGGGSRRAYPSSPLSVSDSLILARSITEGLTRPAALRVGTLAVPRDRRPLPHNLIGFVDLEPRKFQVLDDSLGEHLARVVGGVLLENATQEVAAAADRKANRERELVAERVVIHRPVLVLF
jgi:hypothetical protein